MSQSVEVIDLDALVKPVGRIKVFGKEHDVLPVDGNAYDMLMSISEQEQAGESNQKVRSIDIAREIVRQSIPTLAAEEVRKLTIQQLETIVALATKQVDAVRAAITHAEGNAPRPAPVTRPGKKSR